MTAAVTGSGLEGKRAVITGSSMGIGRAVALRLAREGARVVLNARNSEALEDTRRLIADESALAPRSVTAPSCCSTSARSRPSPPRTRRQR